MIKSFKHKDLKNLFRNNIYISHDLNHEPKLRVLMALLDRIETVHELEGLKLSHHILKGQDKDIHSIRVTDKGRLTFRFENNDVHILNYEGCHK